MLAETPISKIVVLRTSSEIVQEGILWDDLAAQDVENARVLVGGALLLLLVGFDQFEGLDASRSRQCFEVRSADTNEIIRRVLVIVEYFNVEGHLDVAIAQDAQGEGKRLPNRVERIHDGIGPVDEGSGAISRFLV